MLPSVSKKIEESSGCGVSKMKEKKSKKAKKSSKKHKKEKKKKKKNKRSSSDESDDSSEAEERLSKKKRKRRHFSDAESSSSLSSESDDDEWVEKGNGKVENEPKKEYTAPIQHDDWLGGFSSISTFSKSAEPKERKKDERKGIDSYDPGKSVRELNPYWKDGGDGLPKAFAKPSYGSDDEDDRHSRHTYQVKHSDRDRQSNWKKKIEPQKPTTSTQAIQRSPQRDTRGQSESSRSSSSRSPTPEQKSQPQSSQSSSRDDFLTDQQMNELGAKLVKAEIMGNDELAEELKMKLDRARKFRTEHKSEVLAKSYDRRAGGGQNKTREREESIVLTSTNSKGQSRPVSFRNDSDMWGGRAGRKAKKQKVETHLDGERVRYFADDDKYDIKRMVSSKYFAFAVIHLKFNKFFFF